jgi:hypothetical protein
LKDIQERGQVKNIDQITGMMYGPASQLKDASAFFFTFPTVQGFGNVSGFEFMLQDRLGGPWTSWARMHGALSVR